MKISVELSILEKKSSDLTPQKLSMDLLSYFGEDHNSIKKINSSLPDIIFFRRTPPPADMRRATNQLTLVHRHFPKSLEFFLK